MHYFFKILSPLLPGIKQTNYVYSIDDQEGCTKIVNFMSTGAGVLELGCGHLNHIVKMHYFFKNLLLFSQAYIRQTKYIVLINKEGSTKIVTFMTPWAGVLVARVWPYKSYSENALFL